MPTVPQSHHHQPSIVMAGLDPAIHAFLPCHMRNKGGWVYILTNHPNGVLYVGVTSDLIRRIYEHRLGKSVGFTQKHGLRRLVYFERHEEIIAAIAREKAIKKWPRRWKVQLITKDNFDWADLYDGIL